MFITYSYRIKDQSRNNLLKKMSNDVNFVWNFSNEIIRKRWKESRKITSKYDLNPSIKGSSKYLTINSQTIQATAHECATRTLKSKKSIKFRKKETLGWIPICGQSLKIDGPSFIYNKKKFKIWLHRKLPKESKIKTASICENSIGQWFINLNIEIDSKEDLAKNEDIAIDLGLKTIASMSNGIKINRENLTKKFENKLAIAQRAHKRKRFKKINLKIKNKRRDFAHKISAKLSKENKTIFIGDVSPKKLIKTRFSKSVYDAGWAQLKSFLKYKAIRRSGTVLIISEKCSTVTCSSCLKKTGPSGLSALGVREWICSHCSTVHDRDINAALNILRFGRETLSKESCKSMRASPFPKAKKKQFED